MNPWPYTRRAAPTPRPDWVGGRKVSARECASEGAGPGQRRAEHAERYAWPMEAKSEEAQGVLCALNAELAATAKEAGRELVWSAAEREVLDLITEQIDRKVELAQRYDEADQVRVKIALATEVRLTEVAIARLLKTISTEVPVDPPLSATSMKARRAAQSRWDRERARRAAQR